MSSTDELAFWSAGAGRELVAFVAARAAEVRGRAARHEHDNGQCDSLTGIHLDREPALALAAAAGRAARQYEGGVRSVGEGLSVPDRRMAQAVAAIWCDHPDYRQEWKL